MSAEDERTGPDPTATIALVAAYQEGSSGALESLLERYYPRVRRIVRARMGKLLLRSVEVEDIVQQVFMRVVRDLDRFSADHTRVSSAGSTWSARLIRLATSKPTNGSPPGGRRSKPCAGARAVDELRRPGRGPGPATVVGRGELEDHLTPAWRAREDPREDPAPQPRGRLLEWVAAARASQRGRGAGARPGHDRPARPRAARHPRGPVRARGPGRASTPPGGPQADPRDRGDSASGSADRCGRR